MALVERANPTDRADVERLIAAYHTSEGVKPKPERISWAVEQQMRNRFPGVLIVAREKKALVGRALAAKLLEEAKAMRIDRVDLEVFPKNEGAAAFWKKLGFRTGGRLVFSRDLL